MRARPDEVRPGFRARHDHASRPDRKGGGNFHSEKLPSRGRAKPLCGLCVTMPPEERPLCPALLGHEQRLICQAYANSLLKNPTRRYFETILSRVARSDTIQEIRSKRRETSILDERM